MTTLSARRGFTASLHSSWPPRPWVIFEGGRRQTDVPANASFSEACEPDYSRGQSPIAIIRIAVTDRVAFMIWIASKRKRNWLVILFGLAAILLVSCSTTAEPAAQTAQLATEVAGTPDAASSFESHELEPTYEAMIAAQRDPRVPDLPFADNPDPSQCGIPTQWGSNEPAWLTGIYEGKLIQPTVFLYDSHLRFTISGEAPHGSEVTIVLFQENPVIDYYMVKVNDVDQTVEGWIPAPLLSFEPVEALAG